MDDEIAAGQELDNSPAPQSPARHRSPPRSPTGFNSLPSSPVAVSPGTSNSRLRRASESDKNTDNDLKDKESEEDSGISETSDISPLITIASTPSEGEDDGGNKKERLLMTALQVFFPFLVAGFGTMFAGMLLDYVQHWEVYTNVGELFILVPALLGLKGNLEMTLASRLSTAANLGEMNSWASCWKIAWGNLSLIQGQALIVAGLATLISLLLGMISGEHADLSGLLLVGGASMSAASLASALLGGLMIGIILVSKPLNVNPDNIATPIAASLGDLVTLTFLSFIAHGLYSIKDDRIKIISSSVLCVVLIVLIPVWLYLAHRNSFTKQVVYSGWIPVISAMLISSCGGLILSKTVKEFPGIAVYSPIINGVGGNLAAVQASRLSTALHKTGKPGTITTEDDRVRWWKRQHIRTIPLLVLMVIPASIIFLMVIKGINAGHTTLSPMFLVAYLITAVLQVSLLLAASHWLVHIVWTFRFDPDNIAIPYLTALGDMLGTGLLAVAFNILWYLGDRDVDVGE